MAEHASDDRTEEPTPKRLERAREQGQWPQSREVGGAIALLGVGLASPLLGPWFLSALGQLTEGCLGAGPRLEGHDVVPFVRGAARLVTPPLVTLAGIVGGLGVAVSIAQVGFDANLKRLAPRFDFLDPAQGLKRVFGLHGAMELVRAVLKGALIGWIARSVIVDSLARLGTVAPTAMGVLSFLGGEVHRLLVACGIALLLPAGLDLGYQRWSFFRRMRMSKQEVKEEMRDAEGDPQIKARMQAGRRDLLRRRQLADVPRADVVITNPTHVAVALRYVRERMGAPVVVAKGAGVVAARIRQIAHRHGVPVLERPALARWIFRDVEVGNEIPPVLYRAVAEVLGAIYRARAARRAQPGGAR